MKKNAFTLPEVLITLGIVGVVAALTVPTLIQNYKKHVTETRLKNFYVKMSHAFQDWENSKGIAPQDVNFSKIKKSADLEKWWKEAGFSSYFKVADEYILDKNWYRVVLVDGTAFSFYVNHYSDGYAMAFIYCLEPKYCDERASDGHLAYDGKNTFLFNINGKVNNKSMTKEIGEKKQVGVFTTAYADPYHTMTREQLLNNCKQGAAYKDANGKTVYRKGGSPGCTRLIEYDGWKIKNDYPW